MRKGFTLIELLVTIVILGTVSVAVVFVYQKIADINYQTIYDAKVKEIETSALKYAEANLDEIKKITTTTIKVEELIALGYIEGDDETKTKIIDPRRDREFIDGSVLIYFEKDVVYTKYDAKSIAVKLTQDTSGLTSTQIKLKAEIDIPDDISLDYCIYELNDLKGYYASFTSGQLKGNACNNYIFNNINYFTDIISGKPILTHTATIKIYDTIGRETKQSITARVKENIIDETLEVNAYYANNYPDIKTIYNNKWTNQNIIIVPNLKENVTYEYSLDLLKWNDLPSTGYTQSKEGDEYPVYFRKLENGVVGKDIGIVKTKIDKYSPTCTNDGDSSSWTNQNRIITRGCNDTLSGCVTNTISQTFSTSTQTAVIPAYTISDAAGNNTSCPARTANVYVDKTAPTCTHSGDDTKWINGNRTITRSCSDAHSGCATSATSQTFTTSAQTATISAYTISDKAGNSRSCPARTANVYIDKTAPTCSSSGDSTSWIKANRIIRKGCSDTHSGCSTATTTHTYSSTTQYGSIPAYTVVDRAGNTRSCPARTANVYVDKTLPSCTQSGDSSSWTNGNRVIYKGCSDAHSGCSTTTTSHTFSSTAQYGSIPAYTVVDNAGNSRSCSARTAYVYVDKTKPACSVTQSGTNMVLSYSDGNSGVSAYGMSTSASATYNWVKSMAGIHGARFYGYVRDGAGNTQSCSAVASIACNKLSTWNTGVQYKALDKAQVSGQSGFQITSVSVVSATTSSAVVRVNWRLDVYNRQSWILSRTRNLCLSTNHAACNTSAVQIKNATSYWGPGPSFLRTGSVDITVSPNTTYKVKVYEGSCSAPSCSNYLKVHFTYETGDILRVSC